MPDSLSPISASFQFPDLAGKTLVLTGITRGIGRAMLPFLLEQGLRIIAISRGREAMEAVREELDAGEDQLLLYDCDLADSAAVATTAIAIAASGLEINALLHNAAIDPRRWFEAGDEAFWLHLMQVNLFSAVTLTRYLLPVLRRTPEAGGRILFTGSVTHEIGAACLSAYVASKGAIEGVVRSLAHELQGTGITVNCVVPGAIQVEKETPEADAFVLPGQSLPRRLEPKDLIGPVCLLLSEWGGGITGQSITIDGGLLHSLATPEVQGRALGPNPSHPSALGEP